MSIRILCCLLFATIVFPSGRGDLQAADLIFHGGRIVTVDDDFQITQALAVREGRVLAVGSDAEVLEHRHEQTETIDLEGRMVLPGLIDSHVHPAGASMFEFDHEVPVMNSIDDVLQYVRSRAKSVDEGNWIMVSQAFITRLREQRYPTREELDEAAPMNPVVFRTGPDASLNSLALEASGIDRDFRPVGAGYVERDPETGEPTGILRGLNRYIQSGPTGARQPTEEDRLQRLEELFRDYAAVGLTLVADRSSSDSSLGQYRQLLDEDRLPLRVFLSHHISNQDELDRLRTRIREIANLPAAREPHPQLRVIGVKTFLDGGMLTGSAYMREPWGRSDIYGIRDPQYHGVRFIEDDKLEGMIRATLEQGLQFTAHSVGDGAVHAMLDAYQAVHEDLSVEPGQSCITHANFWSAEAIDRAAQLGVVADIQPAWLYMDARTLNDHFGTERLRYFQPLQSLFQAGVMAGGGSDHMQKIGSFRSVNPYNPFLGMWVTITRQARWFDGQLHPEEALTREQTIRYYTINNAHVLRCQDELGSLEVGKLADLIIIDRDLLECDEDDIPHTRVLATYLAGELVHEADEEPEADEMLP